MQSFFVQKKTIVIEAIVLVLFLAGVYYLYTFMSQGSITTSSQVNEQLLGQNFTLFLKAVNQDKLSFKDSELVNSELMPLLRDFSEIIDPTNSRGRADPFVPYAFIRPLR